MGVTSKTTHRTRKKRPGERQQEHVSHNAGVLSLAWLTKKHCLGKLTEAVRYLATGSGSLGVRVCRAYRDLLCHPLALQPGDSRVDIQGRLDHVGKKINEVGKKIAQQAGEGGIRYAKLYSYSRVAENGMPWQTARQLADQIFELYLDLNRELQEDRDVL